MSEGEQLAYGQVQDRIAELAERLINNPDDRVGERVAELLDWVDLFHREGLTRLVAMVEAWRGEIFLESAADDEVAGTLLDAYGLRDDLIPGGPPETPPPPPAKPTLVQIRRR
ncbi:MAG: hypothetical protein KY431_00330 [Actinobacteria bacterium]|nr:hypothetical protein [Actinomycetota bacterium]